jgi:hypothetical protein
VRKKLLAKHSKLLIVAQDEAIASKGERERKRHCLPTPRTGKRRNGDWICKQGSGVGGSNQKQKRGTREGAGGKRKEEKEN